MSKNNNEKVLEESVELESALEDNKLPQKDTSAEDEAQKKLQEETQATSKKLEAILKEDGFAIQPILDYTPYGINPNVVLVKLNKDNNEQTK